MRNLILSVVLSLVFTSAPSSAFAATYDAFLECDTCTTDQAFKTRANTYAAEKSHSDATYIIQNKSSKDFLKVRVIKIPSFEPGVPDIVATTILSLNSFDLDIRYQKEALDRDIQTNLYEVPSSYGVSGYDFIQHSQAFNNLTDWIYNHLETQHRMESRVRSVSSPFENFESTFRVVVETDDGSRLVLQFENRLDGTGPFTFELVDGRDKDNNTIPKTLQQAKAIGPVVISGNTSINAFLGMMDRFGVGVPVYTNTPGGGTVCKSRIEGNNIVLTCSTE